MKRIIGEASEKSEEISTYWLLCIRLKLESFYIFLIVSIIDNFTIFCNSIIYLTMGIILGKYFLITSIIYIILNILLIWQTIKIYFSWKNIGSSRILEITKGWKRNKIIKA